MRALIDTHVLLWWLTDDERLSGKARRTFTSGRSTLLWSAASSWELAVKISLGKLSLPGPLRSYLPRKLREQRITPIAVEHSHAFRVAELPKHHRDPFDRLLVAQAQVEKVSIISADARLGEYDVKIVW
ncbi:MAG: type II toxin-antitoxin system VapC family toxin [Deltaproteobacteria bacterium]|nr:type II toxin-antitoxin system VapC family toxin [Deltaproteobacteria bacterium]